MNRLWNVRRTPPPTQPHLRWVPILGELQKTLQQGEYLPLRPLPMFESNFVQVTNNGDPVFVHHRANRLTMGVAASLPGLVLPDTLLIARPPEGQDHASLLLSRMIPLDLVHLYVHDIHNWRLKLRLVTGRYYYLELDAPDHEVGFLFDRWIYLINLLREPATTWAPRSLHSPALDQPLGVAPASTWRLQVHQQDSTERACMPQFPYKISATQKQKKVKRNFKSQSVGESVPAMWPRLERADIRKKATENQLHSEARSDRNITQIQLPDKTSVTIRTIFSIISSTINQSQSSSKACASDSEGAASQRDLIETPLHCVSSNRANLPLIESCDHLDMLLWHQDFEDLIDPESSTMTTSSLSGHPCSPALHLFPPHSSPLRSSKKAMSKSSQGQRPQPHQKAPSASRAPFAKEQPRKMVVVPGPPKKAPPPLALVQKAPARSAVPQKTPALLNPSSKAPAVPALTQKPPLLRQKVLHAPAMPQKPLAPPAPKKEPLVPPIPSQKPLASPLPGDLAPAGVGAPAAVIPASDKPEKDQSKGKSGQVVFWGTQGRKVVEMRTRTRSLELLHTTAKESKELLISQTQERALEDREGRGKVESTVHKMKEEVLLDLPNLKSKGIEQRQRWVKTQEVVVRGPLQEHNGPFSVEGITLAKLIITASSKEEHPKPAELALSSWLSVDSQTFPVPAADLPLGPSQLSLAESPTGDQSLSWEEDLKQWKGRRPLRDPVGPPRAGSPKTPEDTQAVTKSEGPIPLPASAWEDLTREPPASRAPPKKKREEGPGPSRPSARYSAWQPAVRSNPWPALCPPLSGGLLLTDPRASLRHPSASVRGERGCSRGRSHGGPRRKAWAAAALSADRPEERGRRGQAPGTPETPAPARACGRDRAHPLPLPPQAPGCWAPDRKKRARREAGRDEPRGERSCLAV
ncbi:Golgi-associated RAB2 interactor protein 5B [Thomomys bottae]